MTTKVQEYVFKATFGQGHEKFPGYVNIPIIADTLNEGRRIATARMFKVFGPKWCALYDPDEELHPADNVFRGQV